MKLSRLGLIVIAVVTYVAAAPVAHDSRFPEGRTLTGSNFSSIQHGAWLVEYYSPKCPHCQQFAPIWAQLGEAKDALRLDPIAPMTLARVNCLISMDLCVQEQIAAYPQITLYYDGMKVDGDVNKDFTLKGLSSYVDESVQKYRLKLAGKSPVSSASSIAELSAASTLSTAADVITTASTLPPVSSIQKDPQTTRTADASGTTLSLAPLQGLTEFGTSALPNEAALDAYLGADHGQGPSFVKFYAPWCPHCRAMAPEYAKLAVSVKGHVNAIAVDCEKYSDLCTKYKVPFYPTLRLYNDGNMTVQQGERTKSAMLAFLQEKGVYTSLSGVRAQELDSELRRSHVNFLYLAAPSVSNEEKQIVDSAGIEYDHGKLLYATDPELLRRFPSSVRDNAGYSSVGSRLLVFKESQSQPSGVLELASLPSNSKEAQAQILQWLERNGHERLAQIENESLEDILEDTQGLSVVLAVLGADTNDASALSAQLDSVRQLANSWAKKEAIQNEAILRFAWLNVEQYRTELEQYNVDLAHVPQLLYFRPLDHTVVSYQGKTWLEQSAALDWLTRVQTGAVTGGRYGSMLGRTYSSVRRTGGKAGSVVQEHPLFVLTLVIVGLLLNPRIRRMIRPVARGYRKLV
ncbi:protein disulfide-isomerase [Malassezia yamatoensis]|uniref:Protein disulfide-isomerase n=1 Tax=Malassezia yamatoensis TaxID=253288 RepID=A0AAJ6CGD5_9BASI|nr:protein disulfide-isomerase [Malassezia yamatoensis]